ncbi:TolC family protein [Massilia putida]|uniref:TolC family protein n=1 Tax=Massilia putida TaxID=1141883 RepID=UPI0012EBB64C|nr:TolC family protein [Massilia putida]
MLLALQIFAPNAKAEPVSLSLAEAQHRALARSRQLPSKDAAIAAARDMAIAAGQRPDPVLKAGVDSLPITGPARFNIGSDFMTMRRIGLMQELTRSDKLRLRAAQYERAADKASADKRVATAQIERDTALAWLDLYYASRMAELVHDQIGLSELDLQAAEAAYRGGKRSQADVFEARSAVALAQDRASDYDRRVSTAQTVLARWTGPVAGAALGDLPDVDHVRLDPATLDTMLAHHPDIAVLDRQQDIARTEAQLARANRTPDWTVEVALQHRGPAFSDMVSVGLSVPLQWDRKNRQDRELAAKLALADQARDDREEMLRAHVAETRVMLDEWQNGRERLLRYRRELLPLAGDRSTATLAAYRGAKATLGEVLAARRNQLEVHLQALQLEASTARLWAQLNFLYPSSQQTVQMNPEGGAQ